MFQHDLEPRTGNAYVSALSCNLSTVNVPREYIQGELISPLEEGKQYYFEYYVHPFHLSIATNQHSVHFSENWIEDMPQQTTNLQEFYLDLEPHIGNTDSIYTELKWIKTFGCYTANGGERYVVIGNFESNQNADTTYLYSSGDAEFLYIDDVSMYELERLVPTDTTILFGGTLPLLDYAGQTYYLLGEEQGGTEIVFTESGIYEIEVHLPDCGHIGSYHVTVLGCEDLEANYIPVQSDTLVCLEDMYLLPLYGDSLLEYY